MKISEPCVRSIKPIYIASPATEEIDWRRGYLIHKIV